LVGDRRSQGAAEPTTLAVQVNEPVVRLATVMVSLVSVALPVW